MYYLIDGNNLAGAMGILEDRDFDENLIDLILEFLEDNKKKVILVFDGNDLMGESFEEDRLKVLYSPKDDHYQSADDKIVEIAREIDPDEGLILITNDNELREEVQIINREQNRKNDILFTSATEFKMELGEEVSEPNLENEDDFSEEEIVEVNEELMAEWS